MPVISLEIGPLEDSTKEQLISQLTHIASSITKIPEESFVVSIRELPFENIGVGGKTLKSILPH